MAPRVGKNKAVVPIYDKVFVRGTDVSDEIESIFTQLKIDANNLAEEAVEHPALFARLALMAEEASDEARWAKRRLELAKAELDGDIRRSSQADGGKKPTEGQIENMILIDEKIGELTEEWLDAERSASILGALRQTFTHRREMLVELMRDARNENRSYGGGGGE